MFTLVDRRARADGGMTLLQALLAEVRSRRWPYYKTYLSRSPRVESLNSATSKPLSILHHARGTAVHGQMRELTHEVLQDLGMAPVARPTADEPSVLWGKRRLAAAPFSARPKTETGAKELREFSHRR